MPGGRGNIKPSDGVPFGKDNDPVAAGRKGGSVKSLTTILKKKLFDDDSYMTLKGAEVLDCLLYTSPSPRDQRGSRMPSSA